MINPLDRADVRAFLAETRFKPRTKEHHLRGLHDFADWLATQGYSWSAIDWAAFVRVLNLRGEVLGFGPIDRATIEDYFADLHTRRPTYGAKVRTLAALHRYFGYLTDTEVLFADPTADVVLPRPSTVAKPAGRVCQVGVNSGARGWMAGDSGGVRTPPERSRH